MNIVVEQVNGTKPVTVMKIQGELDGRSYLDLIEEVQQLYIAGMRHLLLDLSEMTFMSSAGLVGLHTVVTVMSGRPLPNLEDGWGSIHKIARDVENPVGYSDYCKLLQPQPRVQKTLDVTGFTHILEIFDDRNAALNSF
jgi:anti-anti-sigma regulatory factor